jgi:hypothetical protein
VAIVPLLVDCVIEHCRRLFVRHGLAPAGGGGLDRRDTRVTRAFHLKPEIAFAVEYAEGERLVDEIVCVILRQCLAAQLGRGGEPGAQFVTAPPWQAGRAEV